MDGRRSKRKDWGGGGGGLRTAFALDGAEVAGLVAHLHDDAEISWLVTHSKKLIFCFCFFVFFLVAGKVFAKGVLRNAL